MKIAIEIAVAIILNFIATAAISHFLIPVLKSRKMGQKILEIGPRWHKNKEGTPTMGGIAFIIPTLIFGSAVFVILLISYGPRQAFPFLFTVLLGLFGGLIGCIDDAAKLRNKRNEGLTAPQKFSLQVLAAVMYLLGMSLVCKMSTVLYIPFIGVSFDLGFGFYIIAGILICGIMNSVNLTDGIDGLASSVTLVVGIFFIIAGFLSGSEYTPEGVILLGSLIIGACAGFLVYNLNPARVFMGDTGSIFLGGLVVGGAFMLGNPLIIVVAGIIYIIETLSTMLQVIYFKLTKGKRLFKMAPIHHHFEKCGWSENKIVAVFSAVTALFCALSILFGLVK